MLLQKNNENSIAIAVHGFDEVLRTTREAEKLR